MTTDTTDRGRAPGPSAASDERIAYPFDWTEGDRPRTRARVRRASDSVWSAWRSYGTVTAAL